MNDKSKDPELVRVERKAEDKFEGVYKIPTPHSQHEWAVALILSTPRGRPPGTGGSQIEYIVFSDFAQAPTDLAKRKWVREAIDDMIAVLQEQRKRVE